MDFLLSFFKKKIQDLICLQRLKAEGSTQKELIRMCVSLASSSCDCDLENFKFFFCKYIYSSLAEKKKILGKEHFQHLFER
jgi:hypothetical protein